MLYKSPLAKTLTCMSMFMLIMPHPVNGGWRFKQRKSTRYTYQRQCGSFQRQVVQQPEETPEATPAPEVIEPKPETTPVPKPPVIPKAPEAPEDLGPPAPDFNIVPSAAVKASRIEIATPESIKIPVRAIEIEINTQPSQSTIESHIARIISKHQPKRKQSFDLFTEKSTTQLIPIPPKNRKFDLLEALRRPQPRIAAVKAAEEETPDVNQPKLDLSAFKLAADNGDGPVPEPEDGKFTPPLLEIGGADEPIPLGELVQLWIKPPDRLPEDLDSTIYSWTVLPKKKVVIWPDKTRILFGAGVKSSTYVVVVTASHVFVEKEQDKITNVAQRAVTKIVSVKVGDGVTPGPIDPVDPVDPVDPPPPPPKLEGLAKDAYEWVREVKRTSAYTEAKVKADAKKLSESFKNVAAAIQAGTLQDVSAILKATKESNDAAIENRNDWLPWFTKVQTHLQESYNAGTIKTLMQFTQAWKDIAAGLEAASK